MKSEILKKLREIDGYISGQELCETFGVSRTAVWKAMNRLKEEGYEIVAVPNKGYQLIEQKDDLLNENEIKSRLSTNWIGTQTKYYDSIDSTNSEIKRLADQELPHGTLVVTDQQNAGKGRRGRSWDSPDGVNIYMSLLLRPEFEPNRASMLTLVMALSVSKGIDEVCNCRTMIKWPNDIVLNKKKICGILTEMGLESDYIKYVVIGVGINANTEAFKEEIESTATSIRKETGILVQRAELINKIMEHFEANYATFLETEDLSVLLEEYNERLINKGSEVKVLDPKEEYQGISNGVNQLGELEVIKHDGEKVQVYAGEVSVRGIYGYV